MISKSLIACILLSFAVSCSKTSVSVPKQKGNRQAGVHITQAELNSYDTEFQRVKGLGIDVIPLTLPWNTLETNSGFDFSSLDIIDYYYPLNNIKVSLNITPIYAIARAVPSDLQSKTFNDSVVIARFKVLLDSVQTRLKHTIINNFIIGLEVDNYLNANASEWTNYKIFYDSAIIFIKQRWGNSMPVGVETTWSSVIGNSKNNIIDLNQYSDMMVLSYYPNQSDFTVKTPTTVHADIKSVIDLYPSIPIFIVECGYQTSEACNSSEELQREFIMEMFKLWDDHLAQINFMGFLWLTDLSDAKVDQYVSDYGASGFPNLDAFKGYLKTTGLRTYPGTGSDKLGFTQLKSELSVRGW
ncbi:MAG: hypothetical protein QM734_17845 [Cyclobacteriaceae bacterium]